LVFKRRDKRKTREVLQHWIYPPGGWRRGISYITHRVRRLPDPPARIARGIGAGIFASFSPFLGLHFVVALLAAMVIRGNLVASVVATFFGNVATLPFIAAASLEVGDKLFGMESAVPLPRVLGAFSSAFGQIKDNLYNLVTGGPVHWDRLSTFFQGVFLPYLLGGTVAGILAGMASYFLSRPLIEAYQRRRAHTVSLGGKRRVNPDQAG